MDWIELVVTVVISSGISGLIIGYFLNKSLERDRITYSGLQTKRAEVIASIYTELVELETMLDRLNFSLPICKKEEFPEVCKKLEEFILLCKKNRIYFSKKTSMSIESLITKTSYATGLIAIFGRFHGTAINDKTTVHTPQGPKEYKKLCNDSLLEILIVKLALEKEFRDILGVREENMTARLWNKFISLKH